MPAWTEEEIAAVRAAVASGVLTVEYSSGGTSRKVQYQSLKELKDLLAQMEAAADVEAGTPRRSVLRVTSGFRGGRGSFRRNE